MHGSASRHNMSIWFGYIYGSLQKGLSEKCSSIKILMKTIIMADDVLFELLHLEVVTYFTSMETNDEFVSIWEHRKLH